MIRNHFPQVEYDPVSRIIKIEKKEKIRVGKIVVCTAGTADIPVAEEAAQTAEYFGSAVERIYDVGVSGMHRLFSRLEEESGHCCSYLCRLWSKSERAVCSFDNDQFLCKRNCGCEY